MDPGTEGDVDMRNRRLEAKPLCSAGLQEVSNHPSILAEDEKTVMRLDRLSELMAARRLTPLRTS